MSIQIRIASYRDRELIPTINSAIANAEYPDNISFAICLQDDDEKTIEHLNNTPNCQYLLIDYQKSKGACWARSLIEDFSCTTEYILQIDAHTQFVEHWDELCIEQLNECNNDLAILSHYLPAYDSNYCDLNQPIYPMKVDTGRKLENGTITTGYSTYGIPMFIWNTDKRIEPATKPQISPWFSGHFAFRRKSFFSEIPYPKHLYFTGEEPWMSVAAYTSGWSIYTPSKTIAFHKYNRGDRATHWADHDWNNKWWFIDKMSQECCYMAIAGITNEFKGKARTLEDFHKFAGIYGNSPSQ